jgi:hypothetical protein
MFFQLQMLLHIKYPLEPIMVYGSIPISPWFDSHYRAQAMMEMVKNEYLNSLHEISTDIVRMHMDPEFWYQQHNLDSNDHHLNNHMIDRGEMQPEWKRTLSLVQWHIQVQTLQGNFRPKQTDYGCNSIYACRFL